MLQYSIVFSHLFPFPEWLSIGWRGRKYTSLAILPCPLHPNPLYEEKISLLENEKGNGLAGLSVELEPAAI